MATRLAFDAANLVYDLSSTGEFSKDFVLRDQIRRSGVSIFSNIAEGYERDGNKEFANILSIAKGSCGEARSQAIFAHHRKYISDVEFGILSEKLILASRQISGFRNYLQQTDLRGRKFN